MDNFKENCIFYLAIIIGLIGGLGMCTLIGLAIYYLVHHVI